MDKANGSKSEDRDAEQLAEVLKFLGGFSSIMGLEVTMRACLHFSVLVADNPELIPSYVEKLIEMPPEMREMGRNIVSGGANDRIAAVEWVVALMRAKIVPHREDLH